MMKKKRSKKPHYIEVHVSLPRTSLRSLPIEYSKAGLPIGYAKEVRELATEHARTREKYLRACGDFDQADCWRQIADVFESGDSALACQVPTHQYSPPGVRIRT